MAMVGLSAVERVMMGTCRREVWAVPVCFYGRNPTSTRICEDLGKAVEDDDVRVGQ